jgi:hypothetical protein
LLCSGAHTIRRIRSRVEETGNLVWTKESDMGNMDKKWVCARHGQIDADEVSYVNGAAAHGDHYLTGVSVGTVPSPGNDNPLEINPNYLQEADSKLPDDDGGNHGR